MTISGTLPDTLATLPGLPALEGLTQRTLQLSMDPMLDMMGMQALQQKYGDSAMAGMMGHGQMGNMQMGHGQMNHSQMGNMQMDNGQMDHSQTGNMQMDNGQMDHSQMGKMQMGNGQMDHSQMGSGQMNHGGNGFDFHNANRINGKAFDMATPQFAAQKGQYERWVISGEGDMMLHPFHIHGTQFRILSENGKPPAAHRAGWKDTVEVYGARSEVLVRFQHDAPKEFAYMAHCHLLEHEDTGMMLGFTV